MPRVTRSSAASQALSPPPSQPSSASRTRSTVEGPQTSIVSAARAARLAAAGSNGRASTSTASTVKPTRKLGSTTAGTSGNNTTSSNTSRPLWNSAKINVTGADGEPGTPSGGLKRPVNGLARTAGTPRPISRQGSLLPPAPATERKRSSAGVADKSIGMESYRPDREPLKAFLRIMPAPAGTDAGTGNYIQLVNENEVLMVPPADHRLNPSNSTFFSGPLLRSVELQGLNLNPASHPSHPEDTTATPTSSTPSSLGTLYKFTEVFGCAPAASSSTSNPLPAAADPSSNSQATFFARTTLPLVHDFLAKGENCLLFAYGPTGSGKTWTVQGGKGSEEEVGILPRVLDVVWRSLEGKSGADSKARPPLGGRPMTSTPTISYKLGNKVPAGKGLGVQADPLDSLLQDRSETLPDVVPVQDGFEYSIWVSYAEVYNEKIYDLLESPLPAASNVSVSTSSTASTSNSLFGLFSAGGAKAKAAFKGMATVKRSALPLKQEKVSGNKYVAGMKEVRIGSAEEARATLDRGQVNRRVYGTLANRASSRSHSIFTIKVVKTRKGAPAGDEGTTSRFSIVDLAGSERQINSGTTGERLKEAGAINKSLMVLGQCMETLRKNQERPKGTKPHIVPFRHSKLTELFQSFFVGDGKAAMIVNVNPYGTSFDENSHVMKFSAVAKGVMTIKANVPTPTVSPTAEVPSEQEIEEQQQTPTRRKESRVVRLSMIEGGEEEEVLYEEEDAEEDDGEEDEFVNALLEELSALRTALFESHMASVMAESRARARTVKEYEKKLQEMEHHYQERMREDALESELKLNAKLDILTRLQAGTRGSDTPGTNSTYDDSDEEDSFASEEPSQGQEEVEEDEGDGEVEMLSLEGEGDTSLLAESMESPSPLAARTSARTQDARSPTPASKLAQLSIAQDVEEEGEEDQLEEDEASSDADTETHSQGDASKDSIDVADAEDDSFDQSFDDDEEEEEELDSDEYDPEDKPVKSASAAKRSMGSSAAKSKKVLNPLPSDDFEVDIEVPLKGGDSDEEEQQHSYALDKSLVIRPGSIKGKKPKRKLGGNTIKDVDLLEAIAVDFSPGPTKSAASSMGSARSFRR